MEQNAPWNRVVGLTDELHFAKRINQRRPRGILITPAHVHKALQSVGFDTFAEDMELALKGSPSHYLIQVLTVEGQPLEASGRTNEKLRVSSLTAALLILARSL